MVHEQKLSFFSPVQNSSGGCNAFKFKFKFNAFKASI